MRKTELDKDTINKRYRAYKWLQYITFVLSIAACTVPVVIAGINIVPEVKNTESKIALGGVAIFVAAAIALVVFRSLVTKYISKLPYSLTVFISVGVALLLMICLRKIIDDAIALLIVGTIGAAAGLVLELASMYFKTASKELKEMYERMS
jgi:uncharacterized membrane protein YoaK (UPF0700 family)